MKHILFLFVIVTLFLSTGLQSLSARVPTSEQVSLQPAHVRCFLIGQINKFIVKDGKLYFHAVRVRGLSWTFFGLNSLYIFRDMNVCISITAAKVYYNPSYLMGLFNSEPIVVPNIPT